MTPTNELRWFEFEDTVNPETGESFMYQSTYRKLQQKWVDDQLCSLNTNYSEWRDVPVVREVI